MLIEPPDGLIASSHGLASVQLVQISAAIWSRIIASGTFALAEDDPTFRGSRIVGLTTVRGAELLNNFLTTTSPSSAE